MAAEPFSVLLPVYADNDPGFFSRAFESVTAEQERPPDEVVVVKDGPIPESIATRLKKLASVCAVPVTIVDLPENRGLGYALDAGMAACRHDIIARMDADDVSLPERFLRQLPLVESGFDVVGSSLAEIGVDERDVRGIRRPPITHADIVRFGRFHCPFNHPTVVLRRSAVAAVGGYQDLPHLEDYWLWARMLATGARGMNVDEPLLLYRVGSGAYDRRGGWSIARSEIALQVRMRRLGYTSRAQFLRNLVVRGGWRCSPVFLRRRLYGLVFRRGGRDLTPVDLS